MRQRFFRTQVITLVCLAAVSAASAAPQPRPSAAETLQEGLGLLEQGKYAEAVKSFQRADEQAGGNCGPCQLGLSRAYTGLRKPQKAIEVARRAVEQLRTTELIGQAWNQLGFALMSHPKPDLAEVEEAFRKAVETGSDSRLVNIARNNLADVLWRQKKYAEAERMARESLTAEPTGPASLNARIVLCQARTDGAPVAPPEVVYEEAACPKEGLRVFEGKDRVPDVGKEVSPPEKLFGRPPVYNDNARMTNIQGAVMVESIIDEEGCIQNLRVCKSVHPSLDLATLEAVRRWVFRPAELDGKPVKVYYTLTVNFTIGNSRSGPG
ncbi:MAG TPA: TonB family protein [Thermoanaerobaculia bacterium]|nr:TonB family protein [Thermoanaerobaculia bacterium]